MLTSNAAKHFYYGIGSALVLSPNLRKLSFARRHALKHSDAEAIRGDWAKVSQDLWFVFNKEK